MDELNKWLKKLKLSKYAAGLEKKGYDDIDDILCLSTADLEKMIKAVGFKKNHARRIRKNILKDSKKKDLSRHRINMVGKWIYDSGKNHYTILEQNNEMIFEENALNGKIQRKGNQLNYECPSDLKAQWYAELNNNGIIYFADPNVSLGTLDSVYQIPDGTSTPPLITAYKDTPDTQKLITATPGVLGIDVKGNEVTKVHDGYQAKELGIHRGWKILKINGVECTEDKADIDRAFRLTKKEKLKYTILFDMTHSREDPNGNDSTRELVTINQGVLGIDLERNEVTKVHNGYQAKELGICKGWKILDINGVKCTDRKADIERAFKLAKKTELKYTILFDKANSIHHLNIRRYRKGKNIS